MCSLCILEIKSLSKVSLENMSSHIVGSLYFNAVFFRHAEVFILMRFHLFILSFMFLALGDVSLRRLLHGMSEMPANVFHYDFYGVMTYI